MLLYVEVDCKIYDAHSLKEKRHVLKRILHQLRGLNISVSELDHQYLWQRTMLGLVTVANARVPCERVIDQAIQLLDQNLRIECLNIDREWYD
ncbi:hypothetical protein HMI01_03810 [Halolactibacillus miurensis]|uniref:YlxP-like protein n=1 Tax=Halolactibacillus miurensis TaxID=306541 RepID=A0A1I6QFU8_9BACI|nr:DUF503 domain-containing protein [Halolactibacillus miurensis]GEM03393.1 hypothetical protein HMI01_03810 [Halolactibacillus miurensis]SFS51336.1 hypothetical protein SAMN05421668_104128 [Halolactibacillus miurensis]